MTESLHVADVVKESTGPESRSVLVIEDDEIISYLLKSRLSREGFNVIVAADGNEAQEIISLHSPVNLILLDVMLPFVDGFELIEQIRNREDWRDIPIIMLTSRSEERNIVRALDMGANDYVVKPFRPDELMARVRRFVK
jgi:DNA-binding response OmpR family regulator